jgi:protein phosphatase
VRDQNEDVYLANAERRFFVVCDGMGGAPAGEVASEWAAKVIEQALESNGRQPAVDADDEGSYLPQTRRLADAVRRSNRWIYDMARSDPRCTGMGTTVVGASITDHVACVAHVGDSRAYHWHDGRLELVTRDHTLFEACVRSGVAADDATLDADAQNALVRVVGREPDVAIDLTEVPVQPGDYLLLCSDGLTRMVTDEAMAQAIVERRHPQRICDGLVDAANGNGGVDNVTVVVIQVLGGWWQRLSGNWRRS